MVRRLASTAALVVLVLVFVLGTATPAGADEPQRIDVYTATDGAASVASSNGLEAALVVSFGVLLVLTSVMGPWLQRRSAAELDRLQPIRVRAGR